MQLCHAERLIPSLPVFFPDITWARQQKAGMAPIFRGWDCGRGHCSFLLLKAWDELRGSVLPGLPASAGSVLRLGRIWMEQFLVPHVSLGSFIPANPCITPWHQKMCLQSSLQGHDNDFMGGEVCCVGAESVWQVTSVVSTQPHKNRPMEKFRISRSWKKTPFLHWVFMRTTEGGTCGKCVAILFCRSICEVAKALVTLCTVRPK